MKEVVVEKVLVWMWECGRVVLGGSGRWRVRWEELMLEEEEEMRERERRAICLDRLAINGRKGNIEDTSL